MENILQYSGLHLTSLPIEVDLVPSNDIKRRCKIHNCITILSRYNLGKYCEFHKPIVNIVKQNRFVDRTNASKSKR